MRLMTLATAVLLCGVLARAQREKTAKQAAEQSAEAYRLSVTPKVVYAHGKWFEASGKKESQNPLSVVVELKCSKSEMLCYDIEATTVVAGRPNLDVTELEILKWTQTEIIANVENSVCSRSTLTIIFRTRAVTMVDSPKLPLPESCASIAGDAAKQARTYSLVATQIPNVGDADGP